MPDRRKHRGPHPQDCELFHDDQLPSMRQAVGDLSWLWSRGYAPTSSLKLVGDRFNLDARQRLAVSRSSCSDTSLHRRLSHCIAPNDLQDQPIWLDGYNVLTTVEAALAGGVIIRGRDGCFRDMASMHGSYRKVAETMPAMQLIAKVLQTLKVSRCRWLFDQPVSNSGRLKTLIREMAESNGWNWEAELVPDPDPILGSIDQVVVTADSQVLDAVGRWTNLMADILASVPQSWIVDLGDEHRKPR